MARRVLAAAMALCALAGAGDARAQSDADSARPHAVLFVYSRFGEAAYGSNIGLDSFEAQLAEFAGYHVLPVPEIIAALAAGRPLPPNTVGLTIDQAYRSVYTEAWPRLRAARLPFTLFVSSDTIDRAGDGYMTWAQLRELADAGVGIGDQTASYAHLLRQDDGYVRGQIARGAERIRAELGVEPTLFAYPYGEATPAARSLAREAGFLAAFGQQSGVAHAKGDLFWLPRFPLIDGFGGMERFRLAAQALPLAVTDLTPSDPVLIENPPNFGFTVDPLAGDLSRLACFASGQGAVPVERAGDRRIEARFSHPLPPGATRINCTLPTGDGRWRWLGAQLFAP